ncbi:SRPBCC family protein [Candidatus Palauibacter soopunensis]|uniref:CoxG family protein n=1 Tax=Candidatus Palauibacter soopunensis TaxID=3056739 RepID=UPI00239D2F6F|nr:SRPBCC family protein [Candidatus Palauibacter soopunensis]MDE2879296.1 SRPBCC family protein [Candidatus Palauibacter soopunensis]
MRIEEGFTIDAPAATVWGILSDPRQLSELLPGAEITEQIDDTTWEGGMTVKVGPLVAAYTGTVSFMLNEEERSAVVRARGQGKAGMGTADMTMNSRVTALPDGGSEVTMDSDVTVTGILAQLGRGMTQVVSKRMLQEFVGRLTSTLENQAKEAEA